MQEIRYANVDGNEIPVLLSDENEALQAAKAAGRAIVGLWREDMPGEDWCVADTLIGDLEDADEQFLERIARRHLGLPWKICETERLIIRELAEDDFQAVVDNRVDAGFDSKEKVEQYVKQHYQIFEFGFWGLEEKKSGKLVGIAGFRIPQEDLCAGAEEYFLSLRPELDLDDVLELGYHIFPEYRRQGYAVEACQAAIEYVKEEFGILQFVIRIEPSNFASKQVAKKLGFKK